MFAETYPLPSGASSEKLKCKHSFQRGKRKRVPENGFWCIHCGAYVYTLAGVSGVQNRNHCPYCLWSQHVDHFQSGDRLSACKAIMQPIGLTVKPARNKYARSCAGELMVIHQCNHCGKLSINRIASDDLSEVVAAVFHTSLKLEQAIRQFLARAGIHPLLEDDESLVNLQLYGRNYIG